MPVEEITSGAIQPTDNLSKRLVDNDVDLGSDSFRLLLVTENPTLALAASDLWSSISSTELPTNGEYVQHGQSIATSTSRTNTTTSFTASNTQSWVFTSNTLIGWAVLVDTSISGVPAEADATDIVIGSFKVKSGNDLEVLNTDELQISLGTILKIDKL